ncbi:2-amino-4-hydroxy-6-hydroxymethyldihydropteridine diphosphokinase [Sulfurimonas sp. SWIR-19]|uniref:2-amino-4-hydroxy-6- hydroxymethyldihydropteridine diphosphokinase n=1 Tax=Sulfurimonas sp. SWIR-19 TaxID=2878390 RepID=UPI001CF50F6C|nr:2-amino-4-hydroxy-6-hydroxymethyldihydropteridine diphosphokinase [Sulfurimonas sp. SWIR-19]UCN01041.1 2-amino-4-hydroxy-6-hydroxymethyldihydropteridine diphosphokinase [Sulfurimonas sp. SWIR-19]
MYRKRKINKRLTSFYNLHFPYTAHAKSRHRYETVVGVGGNVGDVRRRFEHLLVVLQKDKRVSVVKTSLILKNPPFGYTDQDDFFNAILVLKTSMQPRVFLRFLLRLEKKFGRKRTFENAPRTLDLDIIFFDNRTIHTQDLIVPHPFYAQRESVMIPLSGVGR